MVKIKEVRELKPKIREVEELRRQKEVSKTHLIEEFHEEAPIKESSPEATLQAREGISSRVSELRELPSEPRPATAREGEGQWSNFYDNKNTPTQNQQVYRNVTDSGSGGTIRPQFRDRPVEQPSPQTFRAEV